MSETFTRFKRADSDLTRVLLLDLLLNGYSVEEIEKVEEVTEHKLFAGLKRKVVRAYGLTKEAVDVKAFYQERAQILVPTICSLQSYEMCTVSDVAYCHKARDSEHPLKIHDLGIIAPHMVITPDTVISNKKARPLNECEYGFTSFMEYILKDEFEIGNWTVKYNWENKEFSIFYTSKSPKIADEEIKTFSELIYQSEEYSKDATFALVLYLIKKVYADLIERGEKFQPDWFIVERWVREKGK